jgi:hypothetical protein
MPSSFSRSPDSAWIDMPTSLMFSSRFWAVTTSSWTVAVAAASRLRAGALGACAAGDWAHADCAASMRTEAETPQSASECLVMGFLSPVSCSA